MKTLNVLAVATALTFTSSASFAKTVDYKIDPTHSATVFTWDHFGFSTPSGNFTNIQGVIKVDEKNPEKSSVNVTIPLESVNSNVKLLDEHLLGAEWFDAKKYPTITFKSTKVETTDSKNFKITGDLTVKGVTKPVVLDAVLNKKAPHPMTKLDTVGFNATTSFDRSAFGIAAYVPNVGDKISVNITTEASVVKK